MDQKKIGSLLKELRKEKRLTQEQLAEHFNVSTRSVSRWENGINMPELSLLIELADFYNVDIREIIDGERKSETMEKEAKEVAEKMSDYAGAEKEALIKNTRNLSIIGACALGGYFLFKITGTITQRAEFETAYRYCEMLVFITTPLIPLYMTGLLGKMKRRKKNAKSKRT